MTKRIIQLPLLLTIAMSLTLTSCRKNKKCVVVPSTGEYINMPIGQSCQQPSYFDENIEALVLEEDDFMDQSSGTKLALTDNSSDLQEFTFEQIESHPDAQVVYFPYDSKKPRADQKDTIKTAAQKIKQWHKEGKTICCKGHSCEWRGTKAYNHALSDNRASITSQTLAQLAQVPTSAFKTFGVGNEEPVTHDNSQEGQAINRRVEIYPLT